MCSIRTFILEMTRMHAHTHYTHITLTFVAARSTEYHDSRVLGILLNLQIAEALLFHVSRYGGAFHEHIIRIFCNGWMFAEIIFMLFFAYIAV